MLIQDGSQDRPKMAPRPLQDDLQKLLFSSSFLSSILVRFGCLLGPILGSKIEPKSVPRGSSKALKIISVLQWLLEPSKINLLTNIAPTWPDFWSPKGAKMRPKWDQKQTKIEDKNEDEKRSSRRSSWSRLEAILNRFECRLGALEALQTLRLPMFREN